MGLPTIDTIEADRGINSSGAPLTPDQRIQLEAVVARARQELTRVFVERTSAQKHAMMRAARSGSFDVVHGQDEALALSADLTARYGPESKGFLRLQASLPGMAAGSMLHLFTTRENEPAQWQVASTERAREELCDSAEDPWEVVNLVAVPAPADNLARTTVLRTPGQSSSSPDVRRIRRLRTLGSS